MNISVKGTIKFINMGSGAWAIESDEGKTYQLFLRSFPEELLKEGKKMILHGKIRDDVMTTAMIGTVLEIESFEKLG